MTKNLQFFDCYCYNDDCNQKQWEHMGKEGKREYCCVSDVYVPILYKKVPRCPWCGKKMTVTAPMEDSY